jgi:3-methylcrotonyl-CoA carboxylase alpha subunit
MFDKILIANRGEIACRVMATAQKLGIATVAVYSDADAGAKHVQIADEAVRLGPAQAAESYLRGDKIIEAAQQTGAQAIHPGYGFLSENPDFVEAVAAAGLIFIGPPADAIRAMGLKDAAKALMDQAGVPVVPGYHGAEQDPDALAEEAETIGYPVLIKARAGGGGKGMRKVDHAAQFRSELAAAQREAQASFGDPHCLIEKYITQPRHIEIQVFADAHGHAVHLFERDCSLQRRHQKVIEEAPAPGMPEEVREAMGRAAVEAARAIGYQGAGTVEFIADGSTGLRTGGFWFMEMNTRLQVEHPVTEAITGLDLVALQLRVAAGEPLPFSQDDLWINGHSFEARLYAEDPARDFLPAIGTLDQLRFPEGGAFRTMSYRIDSGVREGDAVSPFYDPMIAKVITHGPDRTTALRRLTKALAETRLAGLTTNRDFLLGLTQHADFAAGEVDTGLIARDQAALTQLPPPSPELRAVAGLAALGLAEPRGAGGPWDSLTGFHPWGALTQTARLIYDGAPLDLRLEISGSSVSVDDVLYQVSAGADGAVRIGPLSAEGNAPQITAHYHRAGRRITVTAGAQSYVFEMPDPLAGQSAAAASADTVRSPMPGRITAITAEPGQRVTQGQPLMVLEAMKMEHVLEAPRDGVVAELGAALHDQVQDGTVLVRLEAQDD